MSNNHFITLIDQEFPLQEGLFNVRLQLQKCLLPDPLFGPSADQSTRSQRTRQIARFRPHAFWREANHLFFVSYLEGVKYQTKITIPETISATRSTKSGGYEVGADSIELIVQVTTGRTPRPSSNVLHGGSELAQLTRQADQYRQAMRKIVQ